MNRHISEQYDEELDSAVRFIEGQEHEYSGITQTTDAAAAVRLHALTDFCQALFCLNEFIYVE